MKTFSERERKPSVKYERVEIHGLQENDKTY